MSAQHILITGGTGFIGTALCHQLSQKKHRITVISRQARAASDSVSYVQHPDQLTDDVDVVINLAGEPLDAGRWNEARKQRFCESRMQVTQTLIDWMRSCRKPPHTLVSASAIGWYGHQGQKALSERSEPRSGFSHELCAAWESCALQAEELGVRVCIVRIGIVLERDGGSLARMLLPFKLGLGGPMGSGSQMMSWIHRQDLVNLIEHLSEHRSLQGVFNGTAPNPVSNQQFSECLAAQLNRPAWFRLPAPILRLAFGEMADELLLNGQCVLPAAATAAGFAFQYEDLKPALAAILNQH